MLLLHFRPADRLQSGSVHANAAGWRLFRPGTPELTIAAKRRQIAGEIVKQATDRYLNPVDSAMG
jgi:hypothetical protein